MTGVGHVVVAVPARDEEETLGACLDAVRVSAQRLRRARPQVRVEVVVALDRCLDGSATVAARHPVQVEHLSAGSVGAARGAAVRAGLRAVGRRGGTDASTWLASTDADSVVPPAWLEQQLDLAAGGADLVVGTVEPVGDVEPGRLAAWHARHVLRDGHEYVHGANLGLRADVYRLAGGFTALPLHEDVALVAAVRALGRVVVATDAPRVRTSGRRVGRLEGGFASYLAGLDPAAGVYGTETG